MNLEDYKAYQHGVIYRGAPHTEQRLSKAQCKILMKHYKGVFIRNVYDWDCGESTSFWFIIQDRPILFEELHTKCRNQIRRAAKALNIRRLQWGGVINEGYNVYLQSWKRYKIKTSTPMSKEKWEHYVKNLPDNVEFWGAYDKESGKLIAYAEVLLQDDSAKYTALKAIPEYLNKTYPFYGLLFEMNKYYIEEHKLLYVTDGARSISEHSNIQTFLEKFNFRKAYCRLDVQYIWWMKIIITILYPFRSLIGKHNKLSYLLRFEAINRNEY